MKYILRHNTGTFQINLSIPLEEFRKLLGAGKVTLSLFTLDGHYVRNVDASFLEECAISVEQEFVPIEEVTQNQTGQGFLAMEYPFEKARVLEILKEMNLEYEVLSKEALEYFMTEDPEEFLNKYRNTTFSKGTYKYCIISESKNNITFITYWGYLIDPKKILFAINNKVFTFNFSKRYKILFIPAKINSEIYNKYK